MNVFILYILSLLIGIILFKLLYNRECFNIGIQNAQKKINISRTLSLQEDDCNSNPIPLSCLDDLLFYKGNCYSLLNASDNLQSRNVFFGKYILCEINYIENEESSKKDYVELTETGDSDEIYEFLANLSNPNEENNTYNIILVTFWILVTYILNDKLSFPLPKVLFDKNGENMSLFGYTYINNRKEKIILDINRPAIYPGGGIISYTNNNNEEIKIAFYEDFVFDNIKYKNATFENNKEGYKGYILKESEIEEYSQLEFTNNPADVIVKFYKKSKTVPTGIEPVT